MYGPEALFPKTGEMKVVSASKVIAKCKAAPGPSAEPLYWGMEHPHHMV